MQLLDWGKALARLNGNEALLQEMAAIFCEECPELMANIQEAITQGEAPELRRAAHTLKGEADIFIAKPVADTASRLESIGREGNLAEAEDAWLALKDTMARLLPALREAAKMPGT